MKTKYESPLKGFSISKSKDGNIEESRIEKLLKSNNSAKSIDNIEEILRKE